MTPFDATAVVILSLLGAALGGWWFLVVPGVYVVVRVEMAWRRP